MIDVIIRIITSLIVGLLFCLMTEKSLGAMQQAGYKNGVFLRWLKRKNNLTFNRLCVFALCLVLSTAIIALCFSFLGTFGARAMSAIPFFLLIFAFLYADRKYALKVPTNYTPRIKRLLVAYYFITACVVYFIIALLAFLNELHGGYLYGLVAYVPFGVVPVLLPFILCLANAITAIYENARNKKFVLSAGQVLDEKKIVRVGVVGSYGKTSVKNILYTLLSEKYKTAMTPASYNTPMGIAKSVLSLGDEEVFIVEMGARKAGDIEELCRLVKPDYGIFTGVCAQHISTFENLCSVLTEKSKILEFASLVICGDSLKESLSEKANAQFGVCTVEDVSYFATETKFTLCVGEEKLPITTKLLGNSAVENICLAVALAYKMGLTVEEIARGVEKLQPIPHRLQLIQANGAYVLDDGYNCNEKGAEEAIDALCRFTGRKCAVTPGIVECGVMETEINATLGKKLALANLDKVILVGETLIGAVKEGYVSAGGTMENLKIVPTLDRAKELLADWISQGDAVLFLNDLPDVY